MAKRWFYAAFCQTNEFVRQPMSERIPSTYYCDSNEITTGYSFGRIHRQIDGDTCRCALFTPIGALDAAGLNGRCSDGNQMVQLGVRILCWRTNPQ